MSLRKVFQDYRKKKMIIAIICAFFAVLLMPRNDTAAMSVFMLPATMAGVAIGFGLAQLVELTTAWKTAEGKADVS